MTYKKSDKLFQVYVNGELLGAKTENDEPYDYSNMNIVLILGTKVQRGGKNGECFDLKDNFLGQFTNAYMWKKVLGEMDITRLYKYHDLPSNIFIHWNEFRKTVNGYSVVDVEYPF